MGGAQGMNPASLIPARTDLSSQSNGDSK
jgi:hypothetical protein